jgi:hypothetical protein
MLTNKLGLRSSAVHFPTPDEVASMRERGFDRSTLEVQSARCNAAEAVRSAIAEAFAGVELGAGVGLYEGQALDGYAEDAVRARERSRDELRDWRAIPAARLRECNSSLSFFDAEGMRFHLPAFMLAELGGEFGYDLVYNLTQVSEYNRYYALLSQSQRAAVRAFLVLALEEPECAYQREHVGRALAGYWGNEAAEA